MSQFWQGEIGITKHFCDICFIAGTTQLCKKALKQVTMSSDASREAPCLAHAKVMPEPHGTHLVASGPITKGQRVIEEKGLLKDAATVHTIQVSTYSFGGLVFFCCRL
jgi:hypothetical protein